MKKNQQNTIELKIILTGLILFTFAMTTIKVSAQKNVLLGVLPTVDVATFRGDIPYITDGITFDTITDKNDYQNIKRWVANVKPPINIDFSFPATTVYSADIYTGWYEGYLAGAANGGPVVDFSLQTFDGFGWLNVPGASIIGNTALHVHFNFTSPLYTDQIRLNITKGDDSTPGVVYTRMDEVMIWDAVTALKTTNVDNMMTTYPNPVRNTLNLKLSNPKPGTIIEILNTTGKVIANQFVDGSKNISIDMSSVSSGVYICRYNNGSELGTTKVVKE